MFHLSNRECDCTVRPVFVDVRDNISQTRNRKPAIFTTLKNEGAKTKFISGFATVKNLFFGKTVAMCIQITFAGAAVITIVTTIVSEFNQSADINIMSIVSDSYFARIFK